MLYFSANDTYNRINEQEDILVNIGLDLTKSALNKDSTASKMFEKYSVDESQITPELKKQFREKMLKFAFDQARVPNYDLSSQESIERSLNYPNVPFYLMSIITKIANVLNANEEVEQALIFAEVVKVATGDSHTTEIESKALYDVQESAYGINVDRIQEQLRQPITISPKLKSAAIDFDLIQMTKLGYDWGKQIAKLVKSFRAKMFQDVIDVIYTVSNVSSTVFYLASFAKTTYTTMIDRLQAVNGGNEVVVYGTKSAFVSMVDGITSGFRTQDDINKMGYFTDPYGVKTAVINQAVNASTASFTTRVSNQYVIALSSIGEKPVTLVKGGEMRAVPTDGTKNGLYKKTYTMMEDWNVALISANSYGMVKVS